MSDYSMTCSCGDEMKVSAESRDEAVTKLKGIMTADAILMHMAERHPGELVPSVNDIHKQIAQNLRPVRAMA